MLRCCCICTEMIQFNRLPYVDSLTFLKWAWPHTSSPSIHHVKGWPLLFIILVSASPCIVNGKSVSGVFNSHQAQVGNGQYVTSFAFHGEAVLNFTVNTTGNDAKLYLFLSEDWKDAASDTDCYRRLSKARGVVVLNETSGSRAVSPFIYPRIWHLVYADVFTCESGMPKSPGEQPNIMSYAIKLLNPDSLGNPTEHFGDQETGLLKFYQLLSLTYFVVACMVAPQLYQTLSKGGPMQLVIQLLTFSLTLQAVGAFLVMAHLYGYSKDGIGSPSFELLSEFLDVLSQFAMLFMLLSLSLGWTLASAQSVCRSSHIRSISQKPAARVVAILGLVQGLLFLWEQCQDQSLRMYHSQRSYAGISLVLLRILLAAMFAIKLKDLMRTERSKLKRQFYSSFTKMCLMWFLCYPLIVFCSWIFTEYLRYKLITMGVLVCQWVSGVLLYRLFLSRSLYWEVSALSSSLPLRFNHRFNMKLYS